MIKELLIISNYSSRVRAEFDKDAREDALQKGIADNTNPDYLAFNKYSENV